MTLPEFVLFAAAKPFFFQRHHVEEVAKKTLLLSDTFQQLFPFLTKLLSHAQSVSITVDDEPHTLYSWERADKAPCGWLCKNESVLPDLPIISAHKILLEEMGGIQESYGSDEKDLALCQFFLFTGSRCEAGIDDFKVPYEEWCHKEGYIPLETDHLITFVIEGNGNRTLYDPTSGKVLMFASDHNFNFVTPVPNQPELTFYTINGADTFTEYVELLAQQWLEFIEIEGV